MDAVAKWPECAKPSQPAAPKSSSCRPIGQTLTPSKTSSPSAKLCCAKLPNASIDSFVDASEEDIVRPDEGSSASDRQKTKSA
jgi:hypothetical protein